MAGIIELSSDEDEKNESFHPDNESIVMDLSAILKKYENFHCLPEENTNEPPNKKNYNDVSSNSSEDESNDYHNIQNKLNLYELSPSPTNRLSPTDNPIFDDYMVPIEEPQQLNEKLKGKKRKLDNEDKQLEKLRKEQAKLQKQQEKQRIKDAAAEEKAKKLAMASAYKNLKPEECMKFVTATIDCDLMSAEYGAEIPLCLQSSEVKFKITSQIIPNVVTWCRDTQAQLLHINGELGLSKTKNECEELIIILLWNEFVEYVHKKNLCEQMTLKQSLFPDKKITLGIYGLGNYYRFHKNKKTSKKDQIYAESPKVGRKDVETALIELQILMGISNRMLETSKDIGYMIAQFTKSIAQVPYKLHKEQKYQQMDWYVAGCNKDTVKVDRSGNGLMRLWRQQLTQFALARLETAEAICTKYPSPFALMKAYDECESQTQKEKLLQDLPIRRAAGPLTSVRKLGPELSKKVYTLFNSLDGNLLV